MAGGRSGDAAAEADGRCHHEAFGMNTRRIGSGRYVSFGWSEVAHQFDDILGKLVSVTAQVSADGAGGSDMESSISGNRHIAKGDASQVRSGLVWGFFCQAVVLGLLSVLCSEQEGGSSSRRLAIRFAERAEGVKGPKRLA